MTSCQIGNSDETTIFFRLCLYALERYALRMEPLFVGMQWLIFGLSLILPSTLIVVFSAVFIERFVTTVHSEIMETDQRIGLRYRTGSSCCDGGRRTRWSRRTSTSPNGRRSRSVSVVSETGTAASGASGFSSLVRQYRIHPDVSEMKQLDELLAAHKAQNDLQTKSTNGAPQPMQPAEQPGTSNAEAKRTAPRQSASKKKTVPEPNAKAKCDPVPVPKPVLKQQPKAETKPDARVKPGPEQRPECLTFKNGAASFNAQAVVTETPASFYVVPVCLAASINLVLPVSLPLLVMRQYFHAKSGQMVAYGVFLKCVAVTAIFISMNTIGLIVFQSEPVAKAQPMGALHNTTGFESGVL
ncbi:hypothetical protein V5799_028634 [Amblyomma americanum]|uniref:Uncharacterized protein n=1 Tax=Amblyomma americanum TaxID=6943 RepID=A0AAQ4DCA9_AMBAM